MWIWIGAGILMGMVFLLFCCVRAADRADRRLQNLNNASDAAKAENPAASLAETASARQETGKSMTRGSL